MISFHNSASLIPHLSGIKTGSRFAQEAINSFIPGLGSPFVAVAVFFFAITTMLAFGVYTESNVAYLFRNNKNFATIAIVVKVLLVISIFFGTIRSSSTAWNLADIGVGTLAWLNLIAIILLTKPGLATLRDYEEQKKLGLDPDPA